MAQDCRDFRVSGALQGPRCSGSRLGEGGRFGESAYRSGTLRSLPGPPVATSREPTVPHGLQTYGGADHREGHLPGGGASGDARHALPSGGHPTAPGSCRVPPSGEHQPVVTS